MAISTAATPVLPLELTSERGYGIHIPLSFRFAKVENSKQEWLLVSC